MRRARFETRRLAAVVAGLSTLLLATCDLDKITSTTDGSQVSPPNFSITGGTSVTLGGTLTLSVALPSEVPDAVVRWSSQNPAIASIDEVTGVVTGLTRGTATIRARLLSVDLDTGAVKTHQVTVRFKDIRITPIDSIDGLGLTRAITAFGLNASDAAVGSPLTGVTWESLDPTIFSVIAGGTAIRGLKPGQAGLVATHETLKDTVQVRVRPVAAQLVFADTHFVADALNANRTIPLTVLDVADSVIATPTVAWSVADTSVAEIGAATGVIRFKKKDTTTVFATVDTVTASLLARVIQEPASIEVTSGDAQADTVLHALADPVTVQVLDAGGQPVVGDSVTFRVGIGDSATLVDSIAVTDADGNATLGGWTLGKNAGEQTVIATAGAIQVTITATAFPAQPFKLGFFHNPASVAVGGVMDLMTVRVLDSLDNHVTTATNTITIALGNKPNPSATLGGTLVQNAVEGVASFDDITVSHSGAGYTLVASADGLASTIGNSFDVFGVATQLAFVSPPTNTTAGAVLPEVRVAIQDADGAVVRNATQEITITLDNANGATLLGTTTATPIDGVARFTNLRVSQAGTGYTLTASAAPLTGATSSTFDIAAVGTATSLAFSVQPADAVAGSAIAPAVKVQILDQNGGLVTTSSQQITLELQDGGSLQGVVAINAVSGEATFSNVIVPTAGTRRLVAKIIGSQITQAISDPFTVSSGAAFRLGFRQDPTHTPVGEVISPAVQVEVQDVNGNYVADAAATTVTLALGGNCSAGTLSGNGAVNTVDGIASFPSLTISAAQTGCTLTASAAGLQPATSSSFASVAAGGPVKLSFVAQPPTTVTAGSIMNGGTVAIQNADNETVTIPNQIQINVELLNDTAAIFGVGSLFATSSVTLSNAQVNRAGTYRLVATATGFDPDTSDEFTVVPGPATQVSWLVQPQSIVAGVPFAEPLQVAIEDAQNNRIAGATNLVSLFGFIDATPGGNTRFNNGGQFNIEVSAVDGIATFSGMSVYTAGAPIKLVAISEALAGETSNAFAVIPGPLTSIGFNQEPSTNYNAGDALGTVVVQGQDSVGNLITAFSNSVTLTLVGSNADAVLLGTKEVAPTDGVAEFGDLALNHAGTFQLVASATGVSNGLSRSFTVHPGDPTQVAWVLQPQNTFANAPLNPAGQLPVVAIQDEFGNNRNWGTTIRITIATPVQNGMQFRDRRNGSDFTTTQVDLSTCDNQGCGATATIPAEISLTTFGTGVQLVAATPFESFTSGTSEPFEVFAFDTPTALAFTNAPSNSSYHVNFNPPVGVAVVDQYGNTDTTATNTIGLSLSTNPGGATLSALSLAATKGVATFDPLTLNAAGTGYVLTASAAGFSDLASAPFDVTMPGRLTNTFLNICDLTRAGDYVYWVGCGSSASLRRVPLTGGEPEELVIGQVNPRRMTSDGVNVYWSEGGSGDGQGNIKKYDPATDAVTTMVNGLSDVSSSPHTIDTDGVNVYFYARSDDGLTAAIKSVPVGVAGPTAATELYRLDGNCPGCSMRFIADGDHLYFSHPFDNTIRRVAKVGGTDTTLTAQNEGSGSILFAATGGTLYFSQQANLKSIANAGTITGVVATTTHIDSGMELWNWVHDSGFLYANNNGALVRISLSDFSLTDISLTVGDFNTMSIFTDAEDVYARPDNPGAITKIPKGVSP